MICFDCAYKMTMEALRIASIKTSLNVVYIPIEYPIQSVDRIILSLEKELLKHESVAICIFDHVSSMVSAYFPTKILYSTVTYTHIVIYSAFYSNASSRADYSSKEQRRDGSDRWGPRAWHGGHRRSGHRSGRIHWQLPQVALRAKRNSFSVHQTRCADGGLPPALCGVQHWQAGFRR